MDDDDIRSRVYPFASRDDDVRATMGATFER
jgi:hypothetical protein